MDLFGPMITLSSEGKKYGLATIDDYSRYIWVFFLAYKSESFHVFEEFCRRV